MSQLKYWAERQPEKVACEFPETGERLTYAELDVRSHRVAHWLISRGLQPGDAIAVLMENNPALFEIAWGAQRAGLYYTVVSIHLTSAELAYIIKDSGAQLLLTSGKMGDLASRVLSSDELSSLPCFSLAPAACRGIADYEVAIAHFAGAGPLPNRPVGRDLLYSSGTTGRPKGVRKPLISYEEQPVGPANTTPQTVYGFDSETVYLSPAPLYHAAPLRACIRVMTSGGTCIVLERFDPLSALSAIERYGVTHSQWVPTMFVRMLGLPEEERAAFDISSMRMAIHAAAPCPVQVKEEMIAWWGPIIWEYYAGSESFGTTLIGSDDWLRHKGSVGRPVECAIHILDDDGNELPRGEVGMIYFSGGPTFEYHNAPEKTQSVYRGNKATYGDLGWIDEEGFLYLSDRRSDLIISGGVNIYPKEVEDVLQRHSAVADVAVIGVPNEQFGEEVKACVQLHKGGHASEELEEELIGFCRDVLSKIKCPKTIDFVAQLPRQENGKLPRRLLKERYAVKVEA